MQYDELSQRYQAALEVLLPVLSEAGGQALQDKIVIEPGEPASMTGDFAPSNGYPLLMATLDSTTDAKYEHHFLMDKSIAGLISSWMVGGDPPERVDEEHVDAVKEMVAQILGQLQANLEGGEFSYTAGEVQLSEISSLNDLELPGEGLVVDFSFTRGEDETKHTLTYITNGELIAKEEVEASGAEEAPAEVSESEESGDEEVAEPETTDETSEETPEETAAEEPETEEAEAPAESEISEPDAAEEPVVGEADMAALFGEEDSEGGVVEVSPAEFEEFGELSAGDGRDRKISMLLDVELDVAVELGRKVMVVEDILRLGKGSVVELNKLAGEPVDVLVNGKKLAEGEVVVVEDHFGVRLTHLLEPRERIKSLGR
ncbi:flagellar motor switch protein FliN [Candidatus Neomarinimicrobiota bacterium]